MKKVVDERIKQTRQKIYSETLAIVLTSLIGIVLYKQMILDAELSSYIVELVLFIVGLLYSTVRMLFTGSLLLNTTSTKRLSSWKQGIAYAFISSVIVFIIYLIRKKELVGAILESITFFVVGLFVYTFTSHMMTKAAKRRSDKLESKYDE